jgi:hypothetical protein
VEAFTRGIVHSFHASDENNSPLGIGLRGLSRIVPARAPYSRHVVARPHLNPQQKKSETKRIHMKTNKWTLGLLGAGLVSLPSIGHTEEKFNQVLTALSSTVLSGYVDTSATWKFGTGNANMPGRVYDGPDTQDGFNLNVVSLTLDKALDEDQWSAGYHVQMLLGPGSTKRGTGSIIGGGGDISFNEAYVALRAPVGNGLDFKVGQFGTYNGYEAYDTWKNPNWSRSYGFYIESSAHTGISASYKVNEVISVMAGVANTASFSNQVDARAGNPLVPGGVGVVGSESTKSYLAMITLTAPEDFGFLKGGTLSAGYTGGVNNGTSGPRVDQIYVGASIPTPVEGLTLGLAYDYTSDIPTAISQEGSYAYATALYVLYNCGKWKFNNRFDYAHGSNGAFGYASTSGDDSRNELISYTLTVDYALWKNVISRAEFRVDHALSADRPYGGTVAGVGSDRNSVSLTGNLIYLF